MKNLFLIALLGLMISACVTSENLVKVPAQQMIELDYANYDVAEVTLKNKSLKGIDVAVLSKETHEQIRGFGLGTKGSVKVRVERENKLVFKNDKRSTISIKVDAKETDRSVFEMKGEYISFTLQNKSAKPIPLIIPMVMNPNLSPFSKSGVDLKIGQDILFRAKGKNYVLLTVDNSIQKGDILDVAQILKDRKNQLGL